MEVGVAIIAALTVIDDEDDQYEDPMDIIPILPLLTNLMEPELRPKIYGYVEEIIPQYDEESFRRMFRMSRATFDRICTYLRDCPELQPTQTGGSDVVTVEKQVLITLWYVGSLDTIRKIADRFGVSESTVIMCRERVTAAILNNLKQKIISWPTQHEMQDEVNAFQQRNGFPGIVGAVDGTHIRIKAPSSHPQSYVNRKGFHSIQVQAVCRHNMFFSHIYAGYPGSVHDSRVLKQSDLWTNGLRMCNMANHILGDAAYPTRRWLLTPFRDNGHLTDQQKKYNQYHSSNRVVIERAFALLKGRFRRLKYLETIKLDTSVEIIMICCVLHNICILTNDNIDDFLVQQDDDDVVNNRHIVQINDEEAEGFLKRDNIARHLL
ncbi:putative nuclease HARBI1 [Mytilus edulis]|uniref:Harbinger transposase-derived nuclease n=2 Tax=Mytilus TaxID=6548 RepID=A0A8B6DMQ6_MYTGA|nr:unnamed protein product [Mytilus edulis]VDI22590.1 Hypothetical predicted protein [Mytilus galloprovincialis]